MDQSQLGHATELAVRLGLATGSAHRSRGPVAAHRDRGLARRARRLAGALRLRWAPQPPPPTVVRDPSGGAIAAASLGAVIPAPRDGVVDQVSPAG